MNIKHFFLILMCIKVCAEYKITKVEEYSNLEEIAGVINLAYRKAPFLKEDTDRTTVQKLKEIVLSTNKSLFVCLSEEKVCGSVVLDESGKNPEMTLLTVHPSFQGRGIGNLLIQHLENRVFSADKDLYLNVIPVGQESLVAFYIKCGFKFVGDFYVFDQPNLDKYIKDEYRDSIYYVGMKKVKSYKDAKQRN